MGIGTAVGVAGIASAGASAFGASEQASTAETGAKLQAKEQADALAFQEKQFETQQANEAPFIKAGQGAVNSLSQYAPFTAPTAAQAEATPGYEFTLGQGEEAIAKENAATGNVFSGNELTAADRYSTGLANSTYNDVYNRSLGTYEANLNRLQSLAGEGLTSAGQLGSEGQAAASNVGNIDIATGRNIAEEMNNAAAAEASGYAGGANALTGTVNSLSQYALLNSILNPPAVNTSQFAPTGYLSQDVNSLALNPVDLTGG